MLFNAKVRFEMDMWGEAVDDQFVNSIVDQLMADIGVEVEDPGESGLVDASAKMEVTLEIRNIEAASRREVEAAIRTAIRASKGEEIEILISRD